MLSIDRGIGLLKRKRRLGSHAGLNAESSNAVKVHEHKVSFALNPNHFGAYQVVYGGYVVYFLNTRFWPLLPPPPKKRTLCVTFRISRKYEGRLAPKWIVNKRYF